MKADAITTLAKMVKRRGRRLSLLSSHRARNSSLWFFFMIIDRRKGEISDTVSNPHTPFAHQWGRSCRTKGRKKVSIMKITAMERIL